MPRFENTLRQRAYKALRDRYPAEYQQILNEMFADNDVELQPKKTKMDTELLAALMAHCPDAKTLMPTFPALAKELGCSTEGVRGAFARLEQDGVIQVERIYAETNRYNYYDFDESVQRRTTKRRITFLESKSV